MRRTKIHQIDDSASRDHGKQYLLTEMPASRAELWAARAFLAMANNGILVPDDLPSTGMAGLASLGMSLLSKLPFNEAAPLMAEMMECVTAVPDPNKPTFHRPLLETDIEEVKTRLQLRLEVLKLHSDFFASVVHSKSAPTSDPPSPA